METILLKEFVITFFIAIAVLVLCHRLRVPTIIGLLISGILVGPDILGLVQSREEVLMLAQIGVVLLLFTIGAEFSISNLFKLKRIVLIGGSIQLFLTTGIIFLLSWWGNFSWQESIIIGLAFSLGSDVLVLKMLQEQGQLDTLHGRSAFGILIFQDLALVPMMLFLPLIQPDNLSDQSIAVNATLKSFLILTVAIAGSYWIVPKVLKMISNTRISELFLISVVTICFAVAFISEMAGLSLALGALLAGFIIAESDYAHQAIAHIRPFQQLFTVVFFIALGMLLDFNFLQEYWVSILMTTVVVVLVKFACGMGPLFLCGLPLRPAIKAGLCLSQVGEFSFVLAAFARMLDLIDSNTYQFILSVSICSMLITPLLINSAVQSTESLAKWPLFNLLFKMNAEKKHSYKERAPQIIANHVILIGYGSMGRLISETLDATRIPYSIIELNPDIIEYERLEGKIIAYGDGANENVLAKENLEAAKAVVITFNDMIATRRIVLAIRSISNKVRIIVRAKYSHEINELRALGANDVIAEEVQTAVEIYARTLNHFSVSKQHIEALIKKTQVESMKESDAAPTLNNIS